MNYSFNIEIATKYKPFNNRVEYNPKPCIYFLIDMAYVVYVGKTRSPLSRIDVHHDDKVFTDYSIYHCDIPEMKDLEAYFIFHYQPIYNMSMPNNNVCISQIMAKRDYGMPAVDFKPLVRGQRASVINGVPYYEITDKMREAGIK